ncbi:40S ribosomal protein S5-1 [Hordeum vulgare]|nr:40S ribosomal protein S5-1 [Hordeum vulgare]
MVEGKEGESSGLFGALRARGRQACQKGFGGKLASGRRWTGQMEVCGVLRHVEMATHSLQEEDNVQGTSSACPEGGHQGHSRPQVINPYLMGVLQHPQSIEMREGMLHIRDVEGPKKTGSMGMRLEAMEQQVFKCQGMVERGLNANQMMITEFTSKHKIDANDIGKHLSRLYDRIDQLQAQIYDLQNQNYEY